MSRWINCWFGGKLSAGARLSFIGDSLMHANHSAASGVISTNAHGEVIWARAISGARFRADTVYSSTTTLGDRNLRGANAAVQGAQVGSSQEFDLDEQSPIALAYAPSLVVIAGGTNDLSASDTAANLQTELAARVDYFLSRGIRVILSTIRPRSTAGSGWAAADPKWTELLNLNTWIRSYCASGKPGLYLWDSFDDLKDSGAAQEGEVVAAYVYDTAHLNATGAQVSGAALAAVIERAISAGEFFDTTAANLLPGGAMTGTGGLKTAGVSGSVATGWNVQHDGAVAGNVAAACSKITDDTVMEIAFTSDGAGSSTEGFNILPNPSTLTLTAGRWYQMFVPVEFDASPLWRVQSAQLRTTDNRYQYAHQGRDTTTPIPNAWSGWLMTEPFYCESGDESIRPSLRIVLDETTAATATMRMLAGAMLCEVGAP